MKKIKTDTVMGEDLDKIFKKLNKTVSNEDVKTLDEQKEIIKKTFNNDSRKKYIKVILLILVISISGILYYYCK